MTRKMIIIDGYSLANRAFFALPQLGTHSGQPTNAVYGMTMMLLKLLEEIDPDYCVTAFDVAAPTFRHQAYPAYKGHRLKMEDALKSQIPVIRRLFEILQIPVYEQAGYEADDIIGTYAVKASLKGVKVEIVTGDRDAFQLVSSDITVLYTRKGITEMDRVNAEYIQTRYQLTPAQLIDLKGLMGDSSDNIPGVPGFGEKTALKYLHQYGTIDEIYAHLDEITRLRDRQLLTDYRDQVYLSRELSEIKTDLPFELDLDACCRHRQYNPAELLEFCQIYEFKSLVKKLAGAEAADQVVIEALPSLAFEVDVIDETGLETVAREITEEGLCILQLMTNRAGWSEVKCLGIGLAVKAHNWYLPLRPEQDLPEILKELLANDNVMKYGHDLKKQLQIVTGKGGIVKGKLGDALLAGYLLNAGIGSLELEELTEVYLGKVIPEIKNDRGSRLNVFSLPVNIENDHLAKVAGGRLESLKQLRPIFDDLLKVNGLEDLYIQVEMPLLNVLFQMEQAGIRIDSSVLRRFGDELKESQAKLETTIYALAGIEFNISSPKQLAQVLFDRLGLKAPRKTKTGYSTDIAVLESLVHDHAIIPEIMAYRQNIKLQTTYIDALIELVNPTTGRVHTTFNQAVTSTGRLSSTEPNLQNIPVRSEDGKKIREAFIPGTSKALLLAADYSQIELRVMAHFSKDPAYMDAFLKGQDIHRHTAAAVWQVPVEDVTPTMRDHAKAVNFGIIYGISGFGLARNLGVTRSEAEAFIKAYFSQYPGVRQYVDQLIEAARQSGEARTLMGRVRKLPDLTSRNFTLRSFAERMARNTPIQGTAADIIKLAMVKIAQRLAHQKLGTMLLQVHDELVFEVSETHWRELALLVKEEMEQAVHLDVPLEVDLKIGANWGRMTPVKLEG